MTTITESRAGRWRGASLGVIGCALAIAWATGAHAACKEYPTGGENRTGAIGDILNDRNQDAVGGSNEQPCRRDEPPAKKPPATVHTPPPPPPPPPHHVSRPSQEPSGDPAACAHKTNLPQCGPR
jgi:hypothetical protein